MNSRSKALVAAVLAFSTAACAKQATTENAVDNSASVDSLGSTGNEALGDQSNLAADSSSSSSSDNALEPLDSGATGNTVDTEGR